MNLRLYLNPEPNHFFMKLLRIAFLSSLLLILLGNIPGFSQSDRVIPGADRLSEYLPLLKGKRVAIFANHTSMVGDQNLVDTLHKLGIEIRVVFGPEHGFRGTADAGEKVGNYKDEKTGIPIVSLYGAKHRPSAEDLAGVDVMVFDIQDVGTRFYTYISSLQEYMEASIENKKTLLILDRPNPNGFYVDGPVLDTAFRSFVGMQPVPIVYGMTIGEYADMLTGEGWLRLPKATVQEPVNRKKATTRTNSRSSSKTTAFWPQHKGPLGGLLKLTMYIIPCENYTHSRKYVLPVKPSPNLPDIQSIYCYPSTCFFEGTVLSEGRGTDKPFQLFGHPQLPKNLVAFTPVSKPGANNPKLKDQLCYGWDLSGTPDEVLKKVDSKVQLSWLIEAYRLFPDKDSFFLKGGGFFNKLAGNNQLIQQVKAGVSEAGIRKSWEPALSNFKKIRKKYLLYPDFE